MITFNVIFTAGTPRQLLPFALSLLQGSGVRVRLVDNGCGESEGDLLHETASTNQRLAYHMLGVERTVEHGVALNHLFERFDESCFAIADSDVIASGDFMADLWPLRDNEAAVFSGSSVWTTAQDMIVRPGCTFLGGRQRQLRDGTPIGNTYVAIYLRDAMEPLWRRTPRGFRVQDRYMLPKDVQDAFWARGWRYRYFDTSRALNMQLLLEGHALRHEEAPTLHHVGGFSGSETHRPREDMRATAAAIARILKEPGRRPLQRLIDGTVHRLYMMRSRRDPAHRKMNQRRVIVASHVRAVIEALRTGEAAPPMPRIDCDEVEARVHALVAALEAHYAPGLATIATLEAAAKS